MLSGHTALGYSQSLFHPSSPGSRAGPPAALQHRTKSPEPSCDPAPPLPPSAGLGWRKALKAQEPFQVGRRLAPGLVPVAV